MAQETAAVGWEVTTDCGEFDPTWAMLLGFVGVAIGCYVVWRLVWWFAGTNMDAVGWRAKRYWWPTAMVACGWLLAGLDRAELPAERRGWLPGWLLTVFASAISWLVWHAIVRFLEWRVREREPVLLHLGSGPAG